MRVPARFEKVHLIFLRQFLKIFFQVKNLGKKVVFLTKNQIVSFYPLTSSSTRSAHLLPEKCALLDREVRTSWFRARNEGFRGGFGV